MLRGLSWKLPEVRRVGLRGLGCGCAGTPRERISNGSD